MRSEKRGASPEAQRVFVIGDITCDNMNMNMNMNTNMNMNMNMHMNTNTNMNTSMSISMNMNIAQETTISGGKERD